MRNRRPRHLSTLPPTLPWNTICSPLLPSEVLTARLIAIIGSPMPASFASPALSGTVTCSVQTRARPACIFSLLHVHREFSVLLLVRNVEANGILQPTSTSSVPAQGIAYSTRSATPQTRFVMTRRATFKACTPPRHWTRLARMCAPLSPMSLSHRMSFRDWQISC